MSGNDSLQKPQPPAGPPPGWVPPPGWKPSPPPPPQPSCPPPGWVPPSSAKPPASPPPGWKPPPPPFCSPPPPPPPPPSCPPPPLQQKTSSSPATPPESPLGQPPLSATKTQKAKRNGRLNKLSLLLAEDYSAPGEACPEEDVRNKAGRIGRAKRREEKKQQESDAALFHATLLCQQNGVDISDNEDDGDGPGFAPSVLGFIF